MKNSLKFGLLAIIYFLNICNASGAEDHTNKSSELFNIFDDVTNQKLALLQICKKLETQDCLAFNDVQISTLYFVYRNKNIDTDILCELFCKGWLSISRLHNWTLAINNNGINIEYPKSYIPKKRDDNLKILHITDIHYDLEYVCGCGNSPHCLSLTADKIEHYWGYDQCHPSFHLIENAFDHMRNTHPKIDLIYYTGDTIANIETPERIKKSFIHIYDLISKKFPGIPVFSCLGNHDTYPMYLFSPEDVPVNINTKWLYENVYELWSKWLSSDTKDTILKGGYYTFSPRYGFRIISLNNMDCYNRNWWLLDKNYTMKQLKWLHQILFDAEKSGEYVHILMHIPSGNEDCWTVWAREFNRLVERFHMIISGIFNGHTHYDELNIYYTSKGHAINVAWNAGSITAQTNDVQKNPNYRIYDIESHSMQVVDFETWSFNMTAAKDYSANRTPEWYKLCHFSKDFTNDLSPYGLDALLEKMTKQPELLLKYWRYKMTNADSIIAQGCDNECLRTQICLLVFTSFNKQQRCHDMQIKLEQNLPIEPVSVSSLSTTLSWKIWKLSILMWSLFTRQLYKVYMIM